MPRFPIQKHKRGERRRRWHPKDIPVAIAMLRAGYSQDDIAAFFGQNGGRVSEVNTGKNKLAQKRYVAPKGKLPPPGPYPPGRAGLLARQTLIEERDMHVSRATEIGLVIAQMDAWTRPPDLEAVKERVAKPRRKAPQPLPPPQGSFPLELPARQVPLTGAPASPQLPS